MRDTNTRQSHHHTLPIMMRLFLKCNVHNERHRGPRMYVGGGVHFDVARLVIQTYCRTHHTHTHTLFPVPSAHCQFPIIAYTYSTLLPTA